MNNYAITLASLGRFQDAPPLAGTQPAVTAAVPAATGAPGTAGAPAAPSAGGMDGFLIMMIIFIVVMIGTSIWSQRKEKRRSQAMMSGLRKHDRVLTNAGLIGSIVELKPDTVVLKVDETSNVRITFLRSHISQVLEKSTSSEE
ncbi:MAG: preprotein translocase subunit YajC [Phycisphaerales bacterium]|nr:preprotein translocase subunit YajC [Phycisphaerales bacterium]